MSHTIILLGGFHLKYYFISKYIVILLRPSHRRGGATNRPKQFEWTLIADKYFCGGSGIIIWGGFWHARGVFEMTRVKIKIPHHPCIVSCYVNRCHLSFAQSWKSWTPSCLHQEISGVIWQGPFPPPNVLGLYFMQQIHLVGLTSRIIGLPLK